MFSVGRVGEEVQIYFKLNSEHLPRKVNGALADSYT